MLLVPGSAIESRSAATPRLIVSSHGCSASVNLDSVQVVLRASGSAGGSDADPARAAPATAALATAAGAKARRKAGKRRAAAGDEASRSAYPSGLPPEGRPGKRHRAAAAGIRGGAEAVVARAALGAAEAVAHFAGEAVDEDDDDGDARGALRRLGVRNADPRFAAALAHERADFAEQARSLRMCAVVGCSAAACSRMVRCTAGRE